MPAPDILGNIIHATYTAESLDPLSEEAMLQARASVVAAIVKFIKPNQTYSIRITDNGPNARASRGGFEYVATVLAFPELEGPIV